MTNTIVKPRKSEKLTSAELAAFRKWVKNQPTQEDATRVLKSSRQLVHRVYVIGSGKPETIANIRSVINQKATA